MGNQSKGWKEDSGELEWHYFGFFMNTFEVTLSLFHVKCY